MIQRRSLSPSQKGIVIERQRGLCTHCGEPLSGRVEFDHVQAISLGGTNDLKNFEALHAKPCHLARTHKTVGMKAKADRQRTFQETGHGRAHKRKRWSWFSFSGEKRQSQ